MKPRWWGNLKKFKVVNQSRMWFVSSFLKCLGTDHPWVWAKFEDARVCLCGCRIFETGWFHSVVLRPCGSFGLFQRLQRTWHELASLIEGGLVMLFNFIPGIPKSWVQLPLAAFAHKSACWLPSVAHWSRGLSWLSGSRCDLTLKMAFIHCLHWRTVELLCATNLRLVFWRLLDICLGPGP